METIQLVVRFSSLFPVCLPESFGQNYPEVSCQLLMFILIYAYNVHPTCVHLFLTTVPCHCSSNAAAMLLVLWLPLIMSLCVCHQEADGTLDCISMALTCTFNRWGTLLAVGCNDGRIVIWDFLTRGIAKIISAHIHPVCSLWWDALYRKTLNNLLSLGMSKIGYLKEKNIKKTKPNRIFFFN